MSAPGDQVMKELGIDAAHVVLALGNPPPRALAGAADMMSGLFRNVIWNQTIPDTLRGRLASIEMLSYTSGPALGNFEAGLVASLFSVRISVVSGGVLCVLGCLVCALALPAFRHYDAQRYHLAPDPHPGGVKRE